MGPSLDAARALRGDAIRSQRAYAHASAGAEREARATLARLITFADARLASLEALAVNVAREMRERGLTETTDYESSIARAIERSRVLRSIMGAASSPEEMAHAIGRAAAWIATFT